MQKKKKKYHTDFGGNGVAFLIIGLNQGIAEARSVFFSWSPGKVSPPDNSF